MIFLPFYPILPNIPMILTRSMEKQVLPVPFDRLFLTQFSQICTKTKIFYVKPMKSSFFSDFCIDFTVLLEYNC